MQEKEELMPQKEIEEFVSIFSAMWKEVDRQFSGLSREEKPKVFGITASAFADFMEGPYDDTPRDVHEDDLRDSQR